MWLTTTVRFGRSTGQASRKKAQRPSTSAPGIFNGLLTGIHTKTENRLLRVLSLSQKANPPSLQHRSSRSPFALHFSSPISSLRCRQAMLPMLCTQKISRIAVSLSNL